MDTITQIVLIVRVHCTANYGTVWHFMLLLHSLCPVPINFEFKIAWDVFENRYVNIEHVCSFNCSGNVNYQRISLMIKYVWVSVLLILISLQCWEQTKAKLMKICHIRLCIISIFIGPIHKFSKQRQRYKEKDLNAVQFYIDSSDTGVLGKGEIPRYCSVVKVYFFKSLR